jgi:thymidylate synthase ThyX
VKAAEHLEQFLRARLPLLPNTEWQVQIDERKWIHFIRRWCADSLAA